MGKLHYRRTEAIITVGVMIKNVFVEVSGDLFYNPAFIKFLKKLSGHDITICVGGGTQINEVFQTEKIQLKRHGPLGRELNSPKEKRLAKEVLEKNKKRLQNLLSAKQIKTRVIIPVLNIGQVACHVNGDEMLKMAYLGYDELYAVTPKKQGIIQTVTVF